MANTFLQGSDGRDSNSRLIADIVIVFGLLLVVAFVLIGTFKPLIDLMKIATAVGVLWGSVAGSALLFLFAQKKTEVSEPPKPI
jgi:hypothetical protein